MVEGIINMLKKLLQYKLIKYFTVSVLVTIIDFFITIILTNLNFPISLANTLGMIIGSLTQYIILFEYVYKLPIGLKSFLKFNGTFIFGWMISTITLIVSYYMVGMDVATSKILSIIVTFLIVYKIRELVLGVRAEA